MLLGYLDFTQKAVPLREVRVVYERLRIWERGEQEAEKRFVYIMDNDDFFAR